MKILSILTLLAVTFATNTKADDGQSLIYQGNEAMNQGRYRVAQDFYLKAILKEPLNANIYTLLGFCYHKQRQYSNADSIYRLSIQMDTSASKAHWYKGMNHIALKQDSAAIWHYKKFLSLEKNPNARPTEAYKAIGQSYERILRKEGLLSWQIDDMIYYYELIEQIDPSLMEVPMIRNFVEHVKSKRPSNQVGKWKLVD